MPELATSKIERNIEDRYQAVMGARRWFESNWYLNMAYLHGDHYSYWNPALNRLESASSPRTRSGPKHRVRMVDNQLFHFVRKQRARYVKSKPRFFCTPINDSDEAADNAKTAESILQGLWIDQQIKRKLREVYTWVTVTGNGYLMPVYDTWQGPTVPIEDEEIPMGDLNVEAVSPWEIYLPFLGQFIQDLPWFIRCRAMPVDKLDYLFNVKVKAESVESTPYQNRLLSFMSQFGGRAKDTLKYEDPDGKEEQAFLKECYEKPSYKYPRGRVLSMASGKLLRDPVDLLQDNKDDFDRKNAYRIVHFRDFIFPGYPYGIPAMQHAIPLQKDWNKGKSQIIEYRDVMVKGKYLMPKGSGVTSVDSEHGQFLEYNARPGMQPQQMILISLPADIYKNMELSKISMEDIFAQHEVSRGEVPKNVKSGRAILALQEQDIDQTAMEHDDMEDNLAALGNMMLREAKKIKYEKLLEYVGSNRQIKVMTYTQDLIKGNPMVKVEPGSSIATSKFGNEETIVERYGMGLYGHPDDPKTRKKVLKMLDAAQIEDIFDDDYLDELMAESENELMSQGHPVEVNYWDNHELHIQVLNRYRKSWKFKQMQEGLSEFFEFHYVLHQKFFIAAMQLVRDAELEEREEENADKEKGKVTPIRKGKK